MTTKLGSLFVTGMGWWWTSNITEHLDFILRIVLKRLRLIYPLPHHCVTCLGSVLKGTKDVLTEERRYWSSPLCILKG